MATDEWGIDDGWWGNDGQWHPASPDTVVALRRAMGATADDESPPPVPPTWFVDEGAAEPLWGPATLTLEDGTDVEALDYLPPDLPLGAHLLHPHDGGPTTSLFVTPAAAPTLAGRRWGVALQLYAAHARRSWGIGDLTDLGTVGRWMADRGGTVLAVNPLGEPLPITPREPSPYFPSSRGHLDPLIVDVDRVPGAPPRPHTSTPEGLLDRDAVWAAKRAALWAAYEAAGSPPATGDRRRATFNALAELHGSGWPSWPAPLHDPDGDAALRFTEEHPVEIGFWAWLEATTEAQFGSVRAELSDRGVVLLGDLTVGVDPRGYDAWVDQSVLAFGVGVGAPPDTFNTAGQDWALPPYDPWALRAARYAPFRRVLRESFRRYGGLRIDHVMGLFRLFWIPPGGRPTDGTYVRFHGDELLRLVVLEATLAGAFVVGEDLGTVEPGVREALARRAVGGTRVGWFDPHPEEWPARTLGTLTTHDLPTVQGALRGLDLAADPAMAAQLRATIGPAAETDDPTELAVAAHACLGTAGSDLVLATGDDLVGAIRRPNLPGAGHGYPSWCVPLPVPLDDLAGHPIAEGVAGALSRTRPTPSP